MASRSRWMPCWRVMTGWYRSSWRARASEMRNGRRFSSTTILVMGGSPGRLVTRHATSRARAKPAATGPGIEASGKARPCAWRSPAEEVPDGGAAVVEDVVAAAAEAVVHGEADGVDEVVDVDGDDAVPAAVDQAHLASAHCLHEAGG